MEATLLTPKATILVVDDTPDNLTLMSLLLEDGMPHEAAVEIMVEGRGKHFDAGMIDAFVEIQGEFRDIAARFADHDGDLSGKREYLSQAGVA